MKLKHSIALLMLVLFFGSCSKDSKTSEKEFAYFSEQFADIKILRYKVPGFENLTLKQKELVYYLTQAGLAGRDIMYDQNYRNNLIIRRALEQIYRNYSGDKTTEDWKNFEIYLKRIWFANGIHHHYSNDKFKPGFSADYLTGLLKDTHAKLEGEAFDVIFNDKDAKKVNLDASKDLVLGSAINFYGPDVTEADVDKYYKTLKSPNPLQPLSFGLNSKLVIEDGKVVEKVWKSGGMYGDAIDKIIFWLEKAKGVAENDQQAKAFDLLIKFYQTGDLKIWDDYNVAWAATKEGDIDYINGFIEVYNDPKGYRGSYESTVQIKDFEMSKKMDVVASNAQWFEDNAPIMDAHKKKNVVGVSYKTVNVAGEAGDASPSTPIGINLPNADWIRAAYGSKSVSLGNIIDAYNNAGSTGRLEEFAFSADEVALEKKYGELSSKLHTALHEVIGHASGQINPGIGTPSETLKNYASTLEEARADLVGLYYLPDTKLVEMGLDSNADSIGKVAYDGYIRNGMITQLIRLNLGDNIEEAHMRNRQLVAAWAYEKGKPTNVIEKVTKDGKTYFKINDYKALRGLFGELLKEIQRIKSEGDFKSAQALVETYGVKVDQALHKEVLERNKKFTSAPYGGFINPVLVPSIDAEGKILDIKVTYPDNFAKQMLEYAELYSTLPSKN